jgi:hypothetical protein
MSDAKEFVADGSTWRAQIDKETWLELSSQCERVVDSFGSVGPILEFAQQKSEVEQLRCLMVVKRISTEGFQALKKFAQLWADLNMQVFRDGMQSNSECFEDLLEAARQNPIPETRLRGNAGKDKKSHEDG